MSGEPPNVLHWLTDEGIIHIETPGAMPHARWERLKQYIDLIEPKEAPAPQAEK